MIRVNVFKDSDGSCRGISFHGHAGYDDYGKDMANSVERFTEDGFNGSMDEESGAFEFSFTGTVSSESKLLMDSLILGLQNISEAYGEQYIKIRFEEV